MMKPGASMKSSRQEDAQREVELVEIQLAKVARFNFEGDGDKRRQNLGMRHR